MDCSPYHPREGCQNRGSINSSSRALLALLSSGILDTEEPSSRAALSQLSTLCKPVRQRALPLLFASVKWPHPQKIDSKQQLQFFPRELWGYFRSFSLEWPDEWSLQERPRWGLYHIPLTGDYDAGTSIEPLIESLVHIPTIETFRLDCPFFPSNRLFKIIFRFPKLRYLVVCDTPIYMTPSWGPEHPCSQLEVISLSPAAEALNVGNEVGDPRLLDAEYQRYPHREKFMKNIAFARGAAKRMLDKVASTQNLLKLEVSTALCDFTTLTHMAWDRLKTLVITGPVPPKPLNTYDRWQGHVLDVVELMPQLKNLRLLLTQEGGRAEGIPQLALVKDARAPPSVLSRLSTLAVSLAVDLTGALEWTTSLKSLSILAISQVPIKPTAIRQDAVPALLGEGTRTLERLRLIVEDEPSPSFCKWIAERFPALKHLELEWKGFVDGETPWGWDDFAKVLSVLPNLTSLRLALKFPVTSDMDRKFELAREFARLVPTLRTIGFEFQNDFGKDGWMDWDITRRYTPPNAQSRKGSSLSLTRHWRSPDVWDINAY
ncbi:hypothetical protein DL96DRAFT_1463707 [Flagelloscypha sp. PMI_526]|nr:hypothetical protein DL96DRAFT_1463707 [Flagelloscypha sp. PMI_526]